MRKRKWFVPVVLSMKQGLPGEAVACLLSFDIEVDKCLS